jgi:hypothetical protein
MELWLHPSIFGQLAVWKAAMKERPSVPATCASLLCRIEAGDQQRLLAGKRYGGDLRDRHDKIQLGDGLDRKADSPSRN